MLLLCYPASLIQRNATCSYLNIRIYVNKNPHDCYRIIIIIIIIRIFIHTRSTQILITTVYTQLDNTDAKIIK